MTIDFSDRPFRRTAGEITAPPPARRDARNFNIQDPRVAELRAMLHASGRLPQGTSLTQALRSLGFTTRLTRDQNANTRALLHWTQTGGANALRDMAVRTARTAIGDYGRGDLTALNRFEAADAWVNGITAPTLDANLQARMARYLQSGPIPTGPAPPISSPPPTYTGMQFE